MKLYLTAVLTSCQPNHDMKKSVLSLAACQVRSTHCPHSAPYNARSEFLLLSDDNTDNIDNIDNTDNIDVIDNFATSTTRLFLTVRPIDPVYG